MLTKRGRHSWLAEPQRRIGEQLSEQFVEDVGVLGLEDCRRARTGVLGRGAAQKRALIASPEIERDVSVVHLAARADERDVDSGVLGAEGREFLGVKAMPHVVGRYCDSDA